MHYDIWSDRILVNEIAYQETMCHSWKASKAFFEDVLQGRFYQRYLENQRLNKDS